MSSGKPNGPKVQRTPAADVDVTTFSNAIRLTGREWLCVLLLTGLLLLVPSLWKQYEPLTLEPDYRMPHELGHDYWLYERWAGLAAEQYDTLILGDSVVWGEYVRPHETLSHYLNEQAGRQRYANLGLDGAHPMALAGLVEHYAGSVRGKTVLLQCNPLWLSSPETDLQDTKQLNRFHHPRLVAQFVPHIPNYQEEISPRIGIVVEQHSSLNSWANHLQQAYYGGTDIPSWTLEHPYDNPLEPLARGLPALQDAPGKKALPWFKAGFTAKDDPWIDLDTSLQWQAFQRVVKLLQQRGNRVLVLVGPFNEAMLKPASLTRYQGVKTAIAAWLTAQGIPHMIPAPPRSEWYGDASHPLAAGYAELARQLAACGLVP
jgi:hypothetical protein